MTYPLIYGIVVVVVFVLHAVIVTHEGGEYDTRDFVISMVLAHLWPITLYLLLFASLATLIENSQEQS